MASIVGKSRGANKAARPRRFTFRPLYDMQQGRRKGEATALMKTAVEKPTVDDMIALSAYTASLAPSCRSRYSPALHKLTAGGRCRRWRRPPPRR
jgi:cytochrome c553